MSVEVTKPHSRDLPTCKYGLHDCAPHRNKKRNLSTGKICLSTNILLILLMIYHGILKNRMSECDRTEIKWLFGKQNEPI